MMTKKKPAGIRDRIVEFARLPGRELQDHAGNWRLHPSAQRDAMGAVLRQVGITGALLAYRSERNDGALTLIDGHLRKDLHPDVEWPVLITDLSDDEADLVLATLDPLGAMAEAAGEKLAELVAGIETDEAGLRALLDRQEAEADLAALMAQVEEELARVAGESEGAARKLGAGDKQVKVVVSLGDDLIDFERALLATGNPCRGEALLMVCRAFLGGENGKERQ